MDLTSHEAQVVLRTIGFQLAQAKRNHCALDVAALASRIARKHPMTTDAVEIEGEIMMQAAKTGTPLYLQHS
jgi:hypothetical protein